MKKKYPKPKGLGLKSPALFVFVHGFTNGVMNTAGIDKDENKVIASYINGRTQKFDAYAKKRIIALEKETSPLCSEAEQLILELGKLSIPTIPSGADASDRSDNLFPTNAKEARERREAAAAAARKAQAAAAAALNKEQVEARRSWIQRRLVRIQEELASGYSICKQELEGNAHALRDRFFIYAHGATMQPVNPSQVPEVNFEGFLSDYKKKIDDLENKITTALKKGDIYV